jgi:hypothetical protein
MLIEIWERLRGYDKWVPATAKIESSKAEKTAHYGRDGSVSYTWAAGDELVWTDLQGQQQSAEFKVDDESPLYQLVGGEDVAIRYNPARPDEFYFHELLQSRVRRFFQLVLYTCIFLAVLVCLLWLNILTHTR